jgi:hypothetical protein
MQRLAETDFCAIRAKVCTYFDYATCYFWLWTINCMRFAITCSSAYYSAGGATALLAEEPNRRTAEPPNRRTAESPNRRTAESPNRRTAEPPNRRTAESPNRRTAEPPGTTPEYPDKSSLYEKNIRGESPNSRNDVLWEFYRSESCQN